MGLSTQPLPTLGGDNGVEDPKIRGLLNELQGIVNSNIDLINLSTAATSALDARTTARGKSIIPAVENRASAAYGTLATPDTVTVTLPTSGLIFVAFQGTWLSTVGGAGSAAIFIGANQLKLSNGGTAPAVNSASTHPTPNVTTSLSSISTGLSATAGSVYTGDVTTGQAIGVVDDYGGPCTIFAAAGTYAVSIQFKASSGTVSVSDRKLWVWTMGF
jgi:hypothetical protein